MLSNFGIMVSTISLLLTVSILYLSYYDLKLSGNNVSKKYISVHFFKLYLLF